MSDTTYEPAAESAVDVAQGYDFDGAQPDDAAPADDGGQEWRPSREEWEQMQAMTQQVGGIVAAQQQQAADEQRIAELRDQLEELEWTDPAEYERVVRALEFQPYAQQIAALQEYVTHHQAAEAEDEGFAIGFDLLRDMGYSDDESAEMLEEADGRYRNAVHVLTEQFGGDEHAFWTWTAQQAGVPLEEAPRWLAEQALERLDAEQKFEARIGEADSLVSMVREAGAYANPTPGTTTSIRTERPDSLRDVARRHFGGS